MAGGRGRQRGGRGATAGVRASLRGNEMFRKWREWRLHNRTDVLNASELFTSKRLLLLRDAHRDYFKAAQ